MGTVVVTGANGFIGRALQRHYEAAGARVIGLDLQAAPERSVIAADLTRAGSWHEALREADTVVHAAAVVSNTASADLAWRVNVGATAALLAACADAGVGRFLHLSSVAAFGFDFDTEVDETRPLRPIGNSYVDTKIASEHAVLACHGGGRLDCTIVRPGDVYGPGSRPWVVLPLEMLGRRRFLLPAYGQGVFSPVYVDDLVAGIALAAAAPAARGQIYTLSGGHDVSCETFFGYHWRMLGRSGRVPCTGTSTALLLAQAVGGLQRWLNRPTELGRGTIDMLSRKAGYSIGKAQDQLGYAPRVSLEEGMRRTAGWAAARKLVAK